MLQRFLFFFFSSLLFLPFDSPPKLAFLSLLSLTPFFKKQKGDPGAVLPKFWEEFGINYMTFDSDETGEPYAVGMNKERRGKSS